MKQRFLDFSAEYAPRCEAALERYSHFGDGCPPALAEAIRYSLLAPGKRLRPLLTLAAAAACGKPAEIAMPVACAVEMIHCYSLVHDDLPSMDNDDLRRGRPTNHKVYGEGLAILAGDALQARAFELVAVEITPPELAARCCARLAAAAGASGLVGGQVDDLAAENRPIDLASLVAIHARKTGAMFNACLGLGGLVAGASGEQLRALETYSKALGLLFQVTDDLLDVSGNQDILGKRTQKDQGRGKATFPGLLGVEQSKAKAAALAADAARALANWGAGAEPLLGLAEYVVERDR